MKDVRCPKCGKGIALELEGKLKMYCPRCKYTFIIDTKLDKTPEIMITSEK